MTDQASGKPLLIPRQPLIDKVEQGQVSIGLLSLWSGIDALRTPVRLLTPHSGRGHPVSAGVRRAKSRRQPTSGALLVSKSGEDWLQLGYSTRWGR